MAGIFRSPFTGAASNPNRKKRYSSRSFYLILVALLTLCAASILIHHASESFGPMRNTLLRKRDNGPPNGWMPEEDEAPECRLVHKAKDQCSFILANCEDHEIGLLSYLQLYYCKLPKAKPVAFFLLASWLGLLFSTIGIAASDFLCINLSTIATILGMSESLTGVTFLAFGNGSPDVFSTFAAMASNSGSLAVGELIGAAGFISAVVAGSMAIVRPFKVARRSFVRDLVFFIVATIFSLICLADGELHVWECAAMICFYTFYVVTVVTWHWIMGRRRRKRERDIAARAHFHIPDNQELDIEDEPEDDDPIAGGEQQPLLGATNEDFGALERADVPIWKVETEDDQTRDRYLAELHKSMRVSKAPNLQRGPAAGAIRPSLVGALEFRSVLSSLQKSRNIQSGKIHMRSYSDEPNHAESSSRYLYPGSSRTRAISTNTPDRQRDETETPINLLVTTPTLSPQEESRRNNDERESGPSLGGRSDLLFASPTSSGYPSRSPSPAPTPGDRPMSPNLLAPPGYEFHQPNYQNPHLKFTDQPPSDISPNTVPLDMQHPVTEDTSRSISPLDPFPPYTDDAIRSEVPSIRLPRASLSIGSDYTHDQLTDDDEPKTPGWWPYKWLPVPDILIATLLPTLYGWGMKSIWEKSLGIAAAPSVFFLTITLPVVEPKEPEPEPKNYPAPETGISSPRGQQSRGHSSLDGAPVHGNTNGTLSANGTVNGVNPELTPSAGGHHTVINKPSLTSTRRSRQDSELPVLPSSSENDLPPKKWNRWLLLTQLIISPFFIALTLWTNLDADLNPHTLLLPSLIALLISGLLVVALLLTTKSTTTELPSRIRPFLAFLGFAVSIAWISTLATEVVNLLKSIGVILNISDSLLGLTIFAVGNSLGDLVADITVARLGYPVMALSACFGGPMLNILIGIGVGGLYMTLNPGHGQHSSSSLISSTTNLISRGVSSTSATYKISVSNTLLISGATLLATLVGLLIVVPLNNWRMDRKIGTGLVCLWCISTICNVVIEIVT